MSLIIVCLCFHAYVCKWACVCLTLGLASNVLSLLRSSPKSALSARWFHKQYHDLLCPLQSTALRQLYLNPSSTPPTVHSGACFNVNVSHRFTAEMKSAFNGDFNSFNLPIISLIARTQILLLLLLNRVRFFVSLSLTLYLCLLRYKNSRLSII